MGGLTERDHVGDRRLGSRDAAHRIDERLTIEDPGAGHLGECFPGHGSAHSPVHNLLDGIAHWGDNHAGRDPHRALPQNETVISVAYRGLVIVRTDQDASCVWRVAKSVTKARDEARARLDREDGGVSDRFRRRPRPSVMVWAAPWLTRWPGWRRSCARPRSAAPRSR